MDRSSAEGSVGTLTSAGPEETLDVGRRLGAAAEPGTVLALVGPLGAGKTQLAKGVADGLGVSTVVNSPTFILMNEHGGRLRMFHIDAYRVDGPDEAAAAGLLDERQASGVTVVEWADRLAGSLAADRLELELVPAADDPLARDLRWRATGPRHAELARRALVGASARVPAAR